MSITAISGIAGVRFTHPDVVKAKKAIAAKRVKQTGARTQSRITAEVRRQLDIELRAVAAEPGPRGFRGKAGTDGGRGPAGPKGDKGDKGDRGERGTRGEKGERGTKIFTGPKAPKDAMPDDLWLKPDGVHYELDDGKWRRVTNPPNPSPRRGPPGPTGAPGAPGNRFLHGFGAPSGGRSGDSYLDLEIGDLYLKQRDGWRLIFDFGARAYVGNGAPTESPHDADDILVGDEPASESETNSASESELDFDSESESEFDFG